MRNENQRCRSSLMNLDHQVKDVTAIVGIEVSSRFIGQKNGRIVCKSARDGHSLLFAAGEL